MLKQDATAHGQVGVVSFPPLLPQNPYQRLLYEALAKHGFRLRDGDFKLGWLARHRREVRVLHFHWPWEYYRHSSSPRGPLSWIKLALFAVRLAGARLLGCTIVWTVHEVRPLKTEGRLIEGLGAKLLARGSHVLVANDAETAAQAVAELGRAAAKVQVVPHSSFIDAYPARRDADTVRAELGIAPDQTVFLIFGHISVYKRIGWFVDVFREGAPAGARLIVAGLVMDEATAETVRRAAAEDHRITAMLDFIPDERVAELFAASDVVVCPRQDGGTSGVLVLGLSMGKAVIAARAPAYERLTGDGAAGWLFPPDDRAGLTAAFQAAADRGVARAKGAVAHGLVEHLSWDAMAGRIAELLRAQLDGAGRNAKPRPATEIS